MWEVTSSSLKPSSNGCKPKNHKKDKPRYYNVFLNKFVKLARKAAKSKEGFQEEFNLSDSMLHRIKKIPITESQNDSSKGISCLGGDVFREDEENEQMVINVENIWNWIATLFGTSFM